MCLTDTSRNDLKTECGLCDIPKYSNNIARVLNLLNRRTK